MKLVSPFNLSASRISSSLAGAVLIALGVYVLSGAVWVSVLAGLLTIPALVILKRSRLNRRHRNHLSQFGQPFDGDVTNEIFDESVVGFVPFEGQAAHVIVFADERGILIRKRGIRRLIPWETIAGVSFKQFGSNAVAELNIGSLESADRLMLPWPQELQVAYEVQGKRIS